MVTNTAKPANGTAEKKPTVIIDTTSKPTEVKPSNTAEQPTPEQKEIKTSLQSQREKNEILTVLFEREEKLKETQKNLNRFTLSADEDVSSFDLKDGKGVSFRTGNPVLLKEVLAVIKETLAANISKVTNDIIAVG